MGQPIHPDCEIVTGCTQLLSLQALLSGSGSQHPQLSHLTNAVVNINVPAQEPFQGFYLAHQGSGIVDLNFQQVTPDTPGEREGHMMEAVGHEQEGYVARQGQQAGGVRTFRISAGAGRWYAHNEVIRRDVSCC